MLTSPTSNGHSLHSDAQCKMVQVLEHYRSDGSEPEHSERAQTTDCDCYLHSQQYDLWYMPETASGP